MIDIGRKQLLGLITEGISTEELNSEYDYSGIKDFSYMFYHRPHIKHVPTLNLSNADVIHSMFSGCVGLEEVHLTDVSHIISFEGMFNDCCSLRRISGLDLRRSMNCRSMFRMCSSLFEHDIIPPDPVRRCVTDGMFHCCSSIKYISPYDYLGYDFSSLYNPWIQENYPEFYV